MTSPQLPTESTVPNTATQEDPMPAEPVDLNNAFEALTEEMKFDWPDFSPIDRVKLGLIQSTLGLVLFLGLIMLMESLLR